MADLLVFKVIGSDSKPFYCCSCDPRLGNPQNIGSPTLNGVITILKCMHDHKAFQRPVVSFSPEVRPHVEALNAFEQRTFTRLLQEMIGGNTMFVAS